MAKVAPKDSIPKNESAHDKIKVLRSIRKKQFCKVEMKPNSEYKPQSKDERKPVFDKSRAGQLRKSLNCKGKMVDGTDICKFPERFLRSVSTLPAREPPPTNAYKLKAIKGHKSEFRQQYDRGDLPLYIASSPGAKRRLAWKIHYGEVDFVKYLPLFFEGICEKREPLKFLAHEGTQQLLEYASPASLLKALPAVMRAIYTAFETNDKEVICTILKSIQKLVLSHPEVGPELVQYYRHLLRGMHLYARRNKNLGDRFEYGQHKRLNIADLIDETLHILEVHGGESALYHMRRVVPSYTSGQHILSALPADQADRRQGGNTFSRDMATSAGAGRSVILYDGRAATR